MNKEQKLSIVIAVIAMVLILVVIAEIRYCFDTTRNQKEILKKINSIESTINSYNNQKDSIKTIIITTEKEIDKNNKDYEKTVNTIINSSDSINYNWAKQYIENYRKNLK